jgi:hypothetical protein
VNKTLPGYTDPSVEWNDSERQIHLTEHNNAAPSSIIDEPNNYATQRYVDSSYDEDLVTLINQLTEPMFLGYLENLTAFEHRVTTTPNCIEAGKYIYNEFKEMGLEVRYHNWSWEDYFGSNIEATIKGLDPRSDEIYIVCGHYDTVACPGADDNGGGTAAVLSAAKVMSKYAFNHTVRFVTFSGEEQGLIGSYFYVAEAVENNDNIVAALNADMIGYADNERDAGVVLVIENADSAWITDVTINISKEYFKYINLQVKRVGPWYGSDHYCFWYHGYNAIWYHEFAFNPWYHSKGDVIENMNPSYATNVSKLIMATLVELSQLVILNPPDKPETPVGETKGKAGKKYTYSTSTTDPDGDQVYYLWDWGDGNFSDWLGPYDSGDTAEASYTWVKEGEYEIRVKSKDIYNAESEWSDPLTVTMPKNKPIIQRLLQRPVKRFPLLQTMAVLTIELLSYKKYHNYIP